MEKEEDGEVFLALPIWLEAALESFENLSQLRREIEILLDGKFYERFSTRKFS